MAKLNFNSKDAPTATGFELIPPGRYNVIIQDSELKQTNKGDGEYLKLTFKVIEGDYINRLIWCNLNINNPNSKAVEIAQRDLAAICSAIEITDFEDTVELHGIPLSGQVKIREGKDGYDPQNTISNFKPTVEENDSSAPWA